jgi:hypothetical protein
MIEVLAALTISVASHGLTTVLSSCTSPIPDGCGNFAKPVWERFESDTGEVTKLDTTSIHLMPGGGVMAAIYTYSPGSTFDPSRFQEIVFTCRGQFADTANPDDVEDAPPRSVIGAVAASACALAEPARRAYVERQRQLDAIADARATHPRPEDYCQGFSAEACARIQAGVDASGPPAFCKPGFGLVGSGLTDVQLRICYARAPEDDTSSDR